MHLRVLALAILVIAAGCAGGTTKNDGDIATQELETAVDTEAEDSRTGTNVTVHVLALDGGESSIIEGNSDYTLLGTGGQRNASELRKAMVRYGIDDEPFDLWITDTRPSHLAGARTLLRNYPPVAIGFTPPKLDNTLSVNFLKEVFQSNLHQVIYREESGFYYFRNGGAFEVLAPPRPPLENGSIAHNTGIVRLRIDNSSVIWMGNSSERQQTWLLQQNTSQLQADVLVMRQGSHLQEALQEQIDPSTVIIQGHNITTSRTSIPNREQVSVYRTATEGTIHITFVEENVTIRTGPVGNGSQTTSPAS